MSKKKFIGMAVSLMSAALFTGCGPQTTAEKIENKAEDAGHEVKQGAERAGERVEKTVDDAKTN